MLTPSKIALQAKLLKLLSFNLPKNKERMQGSDLRKDIRIAIGYQHLHHGKIYILSGIACCCSCTHLQESLTKPSLTERYGKPNTWHKSKVSDRRDVADAGDTRTNVPARASSLSDLT